MAKLNYKAAARVLIEHGDFTTFSQVLTVAFPTYMAASAGMNTTAFRKHMEDGMTFTSDHIENMAKLLGVPKKKMKELIQNDPLYKKQEPQKKKGKGDTEQDGQ